MSHLDYADSSSESSLRPLDHDSDKTATNAVSDRLSFAYVDTDPADPDLTDKALREEIDLLAELMVAAAQHDQPLTDAEIDEALDQTSNGEHGPGRRP